MVYSNCLLYYLCFVSGYHHMNGIKPTPKERTCKYIQERTMNVDQVATWCTSVECLVYTPLRLFHISKYHLNHQIIDIGLCIALTIRNFS